MLQLQWPLPPIYFQHFSCDMWHVKWDTWNVTHDMWHMAPDMWHLTHDRWGVGEPSLKMPAPLLLRFGNKGLLRIFWQRQSESIYEEGVCRTSPATPGVLNIVNCCAVCCIAMRYWAVQCSELLGDIAGTKQSDSITDKMPTPLVTTMHCTALHGTALYCTALHCTALYCTALRCTMLH